MPDVEEYERKLLRCLQEVEDERSFVAFLDELAQNRKAEDEIDEVSLSSPFGPGALGWENSTIYDFLESASACWRDNHKLAGITRGMNPWRACAQILYCGKGYE